MTARLALRMSLSFLDGKRRDHGEREIGQGQTPQSEPIMRDLPDAGTQLVDAHEAINREVGGKNPTQRAGRVGDCFPRPCEAGGEKLRQAGCKKEAVRPCRRRWQSERLLRASTSSQAIGCRRPALCPLGHSSDRRTFPEPRTGKASSAPRPGSPGRWWIYASSIPI